MTEGWVDYLTGPYGIFFAFAAGVISFLSPCVLPLVPAYLAHLTGTTATLEPGGNDRRETVSHAAAFVLGFTAVFTLIGASVGLLSATLGDNHAFLIRDHQRLLAQIGAVFLIFLGLNVIGVIRIPLLYRTYSLESFRAPATVTVGAGGGGGVLVAPARSPAWGFQYLKSFGVGSTFALGWTPCIGPVLGAILGLAVTSADVAKGAYLLLVYSLGLGVPFMLTGLAVVPVTGFLRRHRGLVPVAEIVAGVIVIFVGVLLLANEMTVFNGYFSDLPFLDRFNTI
jgi:cytochrome c-type biogenesis protein